MDADPTQFLVGASITLISVLWCVGKVQSAGDDHKSPVFSKTPTILSLWFLNVK